MFLKLTLPLTLLHYNTTVSYSACDTVLSSLIIIGVKASLPLAVTEDLNCQGDFERESDFWFGKSAWHVTSEQHPCFFSFRYWYKCTHQNLVLSTLKQVGQEELMLFLMPHVPAN